MHAKIMQQTDLCKYVDVFFGNGETDRFFEDALAANLLIQVVAGSAPRQSPSRVALFTKHSFVPILALGATPFAKMCLRHLFAALTQQGESRKKTVFERSFFYPIRRIGMESPAGCMESVAKRRHGITRQRVFLLRIDYIQHFVLIPYRRQAADFIHAYRRDYIDSCVEVLDFQGLLCF